MSDIAALAGLSQQSYQKAWDEIPQTLGNILSERRNRSFEQEALEAFKDGVTMDKIQELSRKYPNLPQSQIMGVAAQIGQQGKAERLGNAGSSFLSAVSKDPSLMRDHKKLMEFVKTLGLPPADESDLVNVLLPKYIEQYGPKLKNLSRGERGVSVDFGGKATPVEGMEAKTEPQTMGMWKRDESGDIIQIDIALDPKNPKASLDEYMAQGFQPGTLKTGRAKGQFELFKDDYLADPKNKGKTTVEAFKAYEAMKTRAGTGETKETTYDKKWRTARDEARRILNREPSATEIATALQRLFPSGITLGDLDERPLEEVLGAKSQRQPGYYKDESKVLWHYDGKKWIYQKGSKWFQGEPKF